MERFEGVVLDPQLIAGLVSCGEGDNWLRFFLPGSKKPVILKTQKSAGPPNPSQVYDLVWAFRPKGKENNRPDSKISYWEIRLYAKENISYQDVLRMFTITRDDAKEIGFEQQPTAVLRFDGIDERCVLYLAPLDTDCEPYAQERNREVLFSGSALISVWGEEAEMPGAVKITIQHEDQSRIEIYDRRRNRLTAYGLVERIRVTLPDRMYEFFNILDLDKEPVNVDRVLTNDGLMSIEEAAQKPAPGGEG